MRRRAFITAMGGTTTGTLAGCSWLSGDSPDDVVESYIEAILEDNMDRAEEFVHPESNVSPSPQPLLNDYNILETEQDDLSTATLQEEFSLDEDVAEVADPQDNAIVVVSAEFDTDTFALPFLLTDEDGDWLIIADWDHMYR